MNTQELVKELNNFNEPLGVLSTVAESGQPQSASMYYLCDENLNLFFVTRSGSRKYMNLMKNPRAAFVVTSAGSPKTIQLEGLVSEVTDPQEEMNYFSKLVERASNDMVMPPVSQMVQGEMVFMKFATTWARLGNFEMMKEGDKFVEVGK